MAALLGDQIPPDAPTGLQDLAFSAYYLSIQLGAILSFTILPAMRALLPPPTNYHVSFIFIAVVIWLVLAIFLIPYRRYRLLPPPEKSAVVTMARLLGTCIQRRVRGSVVPDEGFLHLAAGDFDDDEIADAAAIGKVCYIFLTMPFFWMLLDQQATRWVFQMMSMDRRIPLLGWQFPPEATGLYNATLVLILIPLIDWIMTRYPLPPLKGKMLLGFVLSAVAFLVASTLQIFIDRFPGRIPFLVQLPQFVLVSAAEVLVYKSALVFAYNEGSHAIRSLTQALFMLAISVGDLLLSVFSLLAFLIGNRALEFALYSVLQLLAAGVFYLQVRNYVPRFAASEPAASREIVSGGSITADDEEDIVLDDL